jgi:hypothetical protein
MLDIFAWIVLIVMLASTAAVICVAGWLPGHIAKSRNHPWAQAVTVADGYSCSLALPCGRLF